MKNKSQEHSIPSLWLSLTEGDGTSNPAFPYSGNQQAHADFSDNFLDWDMFGAGYFCKQLSGQFSGGGAVT